MKFADIVGQKEIKQMLIKGVEQGRISHAQLFVGQSGAGALPLALAYAQYVNCTKRGETDSCGECPSCLKAEELVHPDLHFVLPVNSPRDRKTSKKSTTESFLPQWRELIKEKKGYFNEQEWYQAINIANLQGIISRDQANEVIRKLSFKAFEARYKIVVMWLPERMNQQAANTLLKIVEEPWERTLFLLVSQSPQELLPTILSRVQEVVVPSIDSQPLAQYLEQLNGLEVPEAERVARLSRGDLIEAQRLINRDEEATKEELFELFKQLMRLSYNDKHLELLEWGERVAALGRERQKHFIHYSTGMLRESYMINAGVESVCYLWGEELVFCRNFAPFIGNHNIEALIERLEQALTHIERNGNAKMIFPHMALLISRLIVKTE